MWAFGVIFAIFGIIYVYARSAFEIGNKFTIDRRSLPWKVQEQIIELARPVKTPQKKFTWYDILNIHAPQNKWLFEDIKDDSKNVFDNEYGYGSDVISEKIVDETILPIIYELDNVEEWQNEEAWFKANPRTWHNQKCQRCER